MFLIVIPIFVAKLILSIHVNIHFNCRFYRSNPAVGWFVDFRAEKAGSVGPR